MFYVSHNISILFYYLFFFFFNDPPTTEIYTLSLHDALPISCEARFPRVDAWSAILFFGHCWQVFPGDGNSRIIHLRSEEHTSELQSHSDLVCRLLLEKKKKNYKNKNIRKK